MRYLFGDYILDTQRSELQHAGVPIQLRRKVLQVLAYLLAHRERVVPKHELLEQLWPDQFVGDEALKSCIKTLRQALGEQGRTSRCVRTLHGQGYRFVAAVEVREPLPAEDAPRSSSLPEAGGGRIPVYFVESYLRVGCVEEAHRLTQRALADNRNHKERGQEAWGLWLLGEIAMHDTLPDMAPAEAHYHF